ISATVHPWYLIFLVLLAIFTEYRFPLLWSAMVILSYFAYSQPEFKESPWLLLIEYLVVIGFMGYEFFKIENLKSLIQKKTGFK
ncbi:MAG: mannosyltransferase, partial [Flavobacteriaceae bacterium]